MSRASRALAISVVSLFTWLFAMYSSFFDSSSAIGRIIPVLPLWVLVTFGAYSLGNVGWALFTFGECPDAHASLLKDIQAAKSDLRSKNVAVD
ncbi:hypothetical protein PhCBS80983_g02955 [Powellomyces hirtus]|uniref:Dolichol-phosphate mannosyltransferase subunit 3 n=1 Tax=Powellomyces hirtus TaxID=109895 RepID=A0A507E4G3_9FUNG|nr:dolichol-phosphate mannosyltransferase subunit 3 [Powellomyces hirtus]TPX58722.1 hypothetical protein PhCBS80983_g02955 [Powellomyces hirtus]